MIANDTRYYNPSRNLADYDGVPFRSKALPHPVTLGTWIDAGLITFDVNNGRMVLTEAGRRIAYEGASDV